MQMARRTRWPGYPPDPNDGRRRVNRPGTARAAAVRRGAARPAVPLPASPVPPGAPGLGRYRYLCTTPACMKTWLVEQAPIG
jgi:hypothetical protein